MEIRADRHRLPLTPANPRTETLEVGEAHQDRVEVDGGRAKDPSPTRLEPSVPSPTGPGLVQRHLEALREAPPNSYVIDGRVVEGLDVEGIKASRLFSMKLENPRAEDALVAAGVALAAGVPSLYLVPERKHLPWFLREADQSYPGQVVVAEGPEKLESSLTWLASRPRQELPAPTRELNAFIGCLMSGLSPEQYAEGRTHLQAIDQALGGTNFCEGIQVSSTTSFGTPKESLRADLDAVCSSRRSVFYVYDGQSRPSGMWVELGVALGKGLPCLLLSPGPATLPPALRQHPALRLYGDHQHLLGNLDHLLADGTPSVNPRAREAG